MEIVTLSSAVAAALIHALPHLTQVAGEGGAKAIGGKLGEQALELAKRLWQHIHPKIEASPAASEAVKDAVLNPEDSDNLASLRKEIKKILEKDAGLVSALAAILQEDKATVQAYHASQSGSGGLAQGENAVAGGANSFVVGGDFSGNVNIPKV